VGGQPIFESAPQPLDRIQLRCIRRKEQEGHILGQTESLGFVRGAVIEEQEMEALGIGDGKVVKEELKALGIEQRQLEKEALAGQRFHGSVQVEALKTIGRGQQRLHPAGRDPATRDGEQATTGFVLGPEAPLRVAVLASSRYAYLELRRKRGLEMGDLCGLFFGCERRGALGLA
jgi:hypothetical protein